MAETPGDLTFRPLTAFDQGLLTELHAQSFAADWDRSWSQSSFADVLAMPGAAGQLAIVKETPIGFGVTLAAVDEVELLLLAILPAHRRHGLAGALLQALLLAAREAGARRAILEVAAPNAAAIACYRRAGFTPCGRRKAYYPGQIDALIFEKPL